MEMLTTTLYLVGSGLLIVGLSTSGASSSLIYLGAVLCLGLARLLRHANRSD